MEMVIIRMGSNDDDRRSDDVFNGKKKIKKFIKEECKFN